MDFSQVLQQLAALTPEQREAALAALSPAQFGALQQVTHRTAWAQGDLRYKWHATQLKIDAAISATSRRRFFLLCSRRTGKTYYLLSRLFSRAIKQPGARLLYLAPFAKDAAEIANDLAAQLLSDCPQDLRPHYNSQLKEFVFRRPGLADSIVRLKGVNAEHARQLRGGATDEIVVDECAQMDDLRSVLNDVCTPMTMTTGGLILLATTPPESPGHYSKEVYENLARSDSAVKFTLLDTPHVPESEKAAMLLELGESAADVPRILRGEILPRTTAALRESFCKFVTDASSAVVPEFNEEAKAEIIKEWPRPERYVPYVSMDPGVRDQTGILFAYYDFLACKLVIEDELLLEHPGTPEIAAGIREKERELWGMIEPRRFLDAASDGGLRLVMDLNRGYGLKFAPSRKDNSLAAVHLMRKSVSSRELVIHPRCVHLIRQLENAVWNKRGSDFAQGGDLDGHWDLVAALKYLTRSIERSHNPYPDSYYAVGGKLGPPKGSFVSPKGGKKRGGLGLYPDTPLGRKLAKRKPK